MILAGNRPTVKGILRPRLSRAGSTVALRRSSLSDGWRTLALEVCDASWMEGGKRKLFFQ